MSKARRILTSPVIIMLALVSFTGCAIHGNPDRERITLLNVDREWSQAAAEGNVNRLTEFWSDDAMNFFPGAPAAQGKTEISQLVKRNRSQPGFALSWEPKDAFVARSCDLGYTWGTFNLTVDDELGNPSHRRGHYVCIWRKDKSGGWKCNVECTVPTKLP